MNKRKQEVNDLEICEDEAAIVRMIFDLAANEGYGAQRIANYLNSIGIKNRSNKNWHPATIQGILRNIIYIGILRSGESRSNVLEHLRIIDDATFETVQSMLKVRSRSQQKTRSAPLNTKALSLLSGNIFCGHCGARLCVTTSGKGRPRKDGTDTRRMRYTCQTKSRTHGDCDGQTGYTVPKLDAMIESIIHSIFDKVRCLNQSDLLDACYQNDLAAKKAIANKTRSEYNKAVRNLQNLKEEIIKSLAGESAFSSELLGGMIQEQEKLCEELQSAVETAEMDYSACKMQTSELQRQYEQILKWSDAYDNASPSAKKMIVSLMIDRVEVYRDYRLKIKFNISIEQFLFSLETVA